MCLINYTVNALNMHLFILFLKLFQMEVTKTLVCLHSLQRFTTDQATDVCKCLLPEWSFETALTLLCALAAVLDLEVDDL